MTLKQLPERFSIFYDLPILLYANGLDIPLKQGVGIVGSRRCTSEQKSTSIMLAFDAVCHNKYVISGMAKGVDSYAHTAAIKETDGITVAVLGHGLDYCYPKEHYELKQYIIKQGLVVSEYPPGTTPRTYYFPKRNRIIAALSDYMFVVGGGGKSGTKTTIDAARRYGVDCDLW